MKKNIFVIIALCYLQFATAQLVNFTSSNLPIVKINTNTQAILNDPKIIANMEIVYNGVGIRNNINDIGNHYNGKVGIEVRGQSSQQFPMKSYSIELWNNDSTSLNRSLLGMPSESDWVLYAPYTDKTLMRNVLAYQISRELGNWAASCRYVELILNNQYKGVYVLMEKIKRKNTRVNISSLNNNDNTYPNVSGGYIFSLDKEPNGWLSNYLPLSALQGQKIQYSYIYPKLTNITTAQQSYLKSYVDTFETALYTKNVNYKNYINTNTFIDFMLVNEISRNVDGYRLSTYFNKDRLGKINAGPVWDFDLAFRNANYCNGSNTSGWAYRFNEVCPQDAFQMPFWWKYLMEDTSYTAQLKCRYDVVKNTALSFSRISNVIDSISNLLNEAQQRHFTQWTILGQYVWPNATPIPTSYNDEIGTLKNWLQQRIAWLNQNIPNNGTCYVYPTNETKNIIVTLLRNPLLGKIDLFIRSRNNTNLQLNMYNVFGQKVLQKTVPITAGAQYKSIDVNLFSNTIHFVNIYENGKSIANFKVL